MKHIRNFSIIAHIDHGKSTLADRLIQHTQVVSDRKFRDQILDTMDIERERGITIKSQTVALPYKGADGQDYMLNLIDTPGHVDFSYEVSRSLASCEGVLLLVDASQGVEAQTVANLYMAMEHDLEVIPVINKIDLPSADVERVREMIENELALPADDAVLASGKTGAGVEDILEAVITRLPPPEGDPDGPLQALIFDSHYDPYRGTVLVVRVINGTLNKGDTIQMMATGGEYKVEEVGVTRITHHPQPKLVAGEVGYIIAGIKVISDTRVGDTITHKERPCSDALPGYQDVQPVVFSSIFPVSTDDYPDLIDAMEKLKLNDASLIYEKDSSAALGFGFRCGFLGLLHLEIVQERLERDFGQSIILTAPSVKYKITTTGGNVVWVDNPVLYPDPAHIDAADEPYISAKIILPTDYLGPIMQLCTDRRGNQVNMEYLDTRRVELTYELPLAEIVYDFYDRLKSLSRGYASFEYELADYRPTDLVKLDVLVNSEKVDALSVLLHRSNAIMRARQICERLKEEIPRQQFKIPIQGAIGGNIIARETISALRKDVLSKCYGGDISRKRKLLEKQKAGKKRMKMVGSVAIPQSAFLSVLKSSDN